MIQQFLNDNKGILEKRKTVTGKIDILKQPRGGLINKNMMTKNKLGNGLEELSEQTNISDSLIGTAVDLYTQYTLELLKANMPLIKNKEDIDVDRLEKRKKIYNKVFKNCLTGYDIYSSRISNKVQLAENLYKMVDEGSCGCSSQATYKKQEECRISAICELANYEVIYRGGISRYKPIDKPNKETISNIEIMKNRAINCFSKVFTPVILTGFRFEGAYTDRISNGDGDYLSPDTLWDLKCIKGDINKNHTLQVAVYWRMGLRSVSKHFFQGIKQLGIFNAKKNIAYTLQTKSLGDDIIEIIDKHIIGYK